ncbi:BTB/POZ domain-containing protein 6-B-like [Sitodiplosis mosellana]|uniref:BTB/POZ domain-containing protein 6-B-like n=1 Tax=Sitodiplosis mosellana TaxID=263140 RepID=UPI002444BDF3|nr:BTB/POZ domain-containing protein 6-B-like [Sitodiplosis mosellana]
MGQSDSKPGKCPNVRKNPLVKQTLEKLHSERDETGDVTFIVESELIRAHRCVLATHSPKYKAQFYGAHPDKIQISVDVVSAVAFKEFLQFFYFDEIALTVENIEAVLNLAKQSLVDTFVTECINFLIEVVTVDNLCWAYHIAIFHDIKQLKDHCEQEISANAKKVFAGKDFIKCDRDLLIRILKLNSLCCKETEVFDGCIAWAKAMCKQKNVDTEKGVNLRAALGKAIPEIRWSSMTVEEFAAIHNKFKGFFTADESSEIFCIISKLKNFKSERFNQIPREQTEPTPVKPNDELISKPHLRCDRTAVGKIEFDLKGNDSVLFFCNQGICLQGFVLGSKDINELKVDVMLEKVHLQNYPKTLVHKGSWNETMVLFGKPIDIKPLDRCYIDVNSSSFFACKDVYGLKSDVRIDDISFKFPLSGIVQPMGLITCLLFSRLD